MHIKKTALPEPYFSLFAEEMQVSPSNVTEQTSSVVALEDRSNLNIQHSRLVNKSFCYIYM